MDNIQVTHNNDNHHYKIAMDIAKEGSSLWDLTPYVKGRVGDNRFGLQVTWTYQGQLMNVEGMKPYIEGNVGQYSVDDQNNLQLDPNSGVVRYVGDPADCQAGGQVTYYFPEQMFPKEGIFKGYIGLLDDRDDSQNPHISGVTVWFKVLPGIAEMGHACDYYISDFEKAEEIFKAKLRQHETDFQSEASQVISDARNSYTTETANAHDSLLALVSQIQANRDEQANLSQHLAGTEQQIEINDIVRKKDFNQLSNQLTQQVSQMRQSGLEFFDNIDKLKSAYPDGANKLCVTLDNSHQYIYDYTNKQWNDAGPFNYGTIDPKLTQNIYAKDADNLILNSDFHGLDMWTPWRDATAPNVYIDTSDAINGSNVAVMNGYIKDGSSNWSALAGQDFPVDASKHPNISFAADIWVTGINTEAGDQACIELNIFDANNNVSKWIYNLSNSSGFQRIAWKNLVLPASTVKCSIAFTMNGLGQYRIRRPQVNYGSDTVPYSKAEIKKANSNLFANNPITEWNYANDSKHFFIENTVTYHDYPTLHIKNNDSENYYFPMSPMVRVDKGAVVSLSVPFKGTRDINNSKVYIEIHQYDDYNPVENTSVRYVTAWLNPEKDKFKELILNDIKLADTTQYIDVRFVTYGTVDIYVGNIALYQEKYAPENSQLVNNYVASTNQFVFYPITNWQTSGISSNDITVDHSVLDSQDNPTLSIKTPADRSFGQGIAAYCTNSNSILRVNSRRFSFKFQYRQNIDFQKGYIEVIIRQYANNQEQFNINKQINLLLPNSNELREIEFDNILLESDTKFIDVGLYGEGCIDANFSNFEQIPNSKTDSTNLIGQFNPSTWFLNNNESNLVSVTRKDNSIELSSTITDDNYLILASTPIDVEPNSTYAISIPSSTNYDSSSNNEVYLEVEQGSTPDEAEGHNVLALFRFDQKSDKTNIFRFTTGKDKKYINFKLVIHRSAYAKFGIISLYQGGFTVDNNPLPQLNIKSDGNITDTWQGSAFEFEDGERKVTGYLQYAIQGDSSRNYPKKNLKIKCFEDSEFKSKLKWKPKADWDKNDKFSLKANYIDATQARNLVNSKIFAKATMITPLSFDNQADLFKSQNAGQMEGFPIELYFNGNYYGLMTFNTKKDDKSFGLDSDNIANEAIEFENGASALSNKDDQLDGINYATIVQDNPTDELKTNFHNLANFINTSSDEDFKAKIGTYIDIKSVFNCILWGLYSSMWDFPKKSMILLTWDSGKTFYLTLYDMDSTWNLFWDGSKLTTEDVFNFSKPDKVLVDWNNVFYKRVYALFKPELQAQYKYLRSNVWRNDQIINAFKEFIDNIPEEAYERDQAKWTDIPSKSITNFGQIQQSVITRGNAMDNFMEHLTDSQPTTPQTGGITSTQQTTQQAQPTEQK